MTAGPRRSSGRDEQMFGEKQQVPHEGRTTKSVSDRELHLPASFLLEKLGDLCQRELKIGGGCDGGHVLREQGVAKPGCDSQQSALALRTTRR